MNMPDIQTLPGLKGLLHYQKDSFNHLPAGMIIRHRGQIS